MFKSHWSAIASFSLVSVLLLGSQANARSPRILQARQQDDDRDTVRFISLFGGAQQKYESSIQQGEAIQKGGVIQKYESAVQRGTVYQKSEIVQKYESAIQHAGPVQKGVYQKSTSYCPEDRCIRYHRHLLGRKVRCCDPPVHAVLYATDPCGCPVEIPVCMPACCDDSPCISTQHGILGCDYMIYDWCCGFRVKLQFHKHGDITVHYYGV